MTGAPKVGERGQLGPDASALQWRSDWLCGNCWATHNLISGEVVGHPGPCPSCGKFGLAENRETRVVPLWLLELREAMPRGQIEMLDERDLSIVAVRSQ